LRRSSRAAWPKSRRASLNHKNERVFRSMTSAPRKERENRSREHEGTQPQERYAHRMPSCEPIRERPKAASGSNPHRVFVAPGPKARERQPYARAGNTANPGQNPYARCASDQSEYHGGENGVRKPCARGHEQTHRWYATRFGQLDHRRRPFEPPRLYAQLRPAVARGSRRVCGSPQYRNHVETWNSCSARPSPFGRAPAAQERCQPSSACRPSCHCPRNPDPGMSMTVEDELSGRRWSALSARSTPRRARSRRS
jgi:hypothetical protein